MLSVLEQDGLQRQDLGSDVSSIRILVFVPTFTSCYFIGLLW